MIVAAGLVVLVAVQSAQFVVGRDALHLEAFRLTAQANQALFAPRQGLALFIDVPELYTYREQELPLGWYGVMVAPWHNRLGAATNLQADKANWVIDPAHAQQVKDRARSQLEFHGQALPPDQLQTAILSATQVFRVEAPQGELNLFQIGQIEHTATSPESAVASWPNKIRLISATLESDAGAPVLHLDWFIGGPIDPNVTVFVHILDEAGQVMTQADGDLIGGYVPIGLWQKNDRIQERRVIALPVEPGGHYHIVLGLYNRATQQRLNPAQSTAPVKDGALSVAEFQYP